MGNLTEHFSKEEFECSRIIGGVKKPHGCGLMKISLCIVHALERCRSNPEVKKIIVTNGCRCDSHPDSVRSMKSGKRSFHQIQKDGFCHAVDIVMIGENDTPLPLKIQFSLASAEPVFRDGGIGVYYDWSRPGLHVDNGPCRRWHRIKGRYISGLGW